MKRLAMLTLVVAVILGFAQAGFAAGESLSGIWEITITGVRDSGRPIGQPKTWTFQMKWLDTGEQVFGSMETARWVGRKNGITLNFQIFSHGNNDRDVKRGGIQAAGNVELKPSYTFQPLSPTWAGMGYSIEPAAGFKAFETFKVSARRVSTGLGGTVIGTNWCDEIDLNDIVQDIFADTFFHPMDVCTVEKNGEGFYLFGSVGPGNNDQPYAAVTLYYPWEWHAVCSSREYSFALKSGGNIQDIQELIDGLKAFAALLNYLGVDATTIENDILSWYNNYGDFAISIGYSMHTGFTTMYIHTGAGANQAIINAIVNSSTGKAIQRAFDHGSGFAVKAGPVIADEYNLRRTVVPVAGFVCNTPVLFVYLFGTINVVYD